MWEGVIISLLTSLVASVIKSLPVGSLVQFWNSSKHY